MSNAPSDGQDQTVFTAVDPAPEASPQSQSCLVMIYGKELGKCYSLGDTSPASSSTSPTVITIGRSSSCEIQVDEETISRVHAAITKTCEGHFCVEDRGSTNGTFLNDDPLKQSTRLKDGDLLRVGRTIFKFFGSLNVEARFHDEMHRLSITDGLTGIYNKRHFLDALDRELMRAFRNQSALSLIMMDVDFFKKINDTFGHLAGDAVLRGLADTVRLHVREVDIFARYGGEEFGLILPGINQDEAIVVGEKLRALVEQRPVTYGNQPILATISLGLAVLQAENLSAQTFIAIADKQLYRAKSLGRNCLAYPD